MSETSAESIFQQRVDTIRHLPQQTEAQKVEKHRAVELLRQETAWGYAAVAYKIQEVTFNHPEYKKDDLLQELAELQLPLKEEVVDKFLEEVVLQKERAERKKKIIAKSLGYETSDPRDMSHEEKKAVGKYLFTELFNGKPPEGEVEYVYSHMAMAILVDKDDDFQLIDNRENIGGFYHDEHVDKNGTSYPLIVVKRPGFLDHEEGHAMNAIIIRTLNDLGRYGIARWSEGSLKTKSIKIQLEPFYFRIGVNILWNNFLSKFRSRFGPVATDYWGEKKRADFLQLMFQDFMPQALSKAKDELLADMQGKHANYKFTHLDNLCKQSGTYDYFKKFYDRLFIKVPEHGSTPSLSLKSIEDVGRDEQARRVQTENRVKAALRQQIVSRTIDIALPDEVLAERIAAVTKQFREGGIKR